MRAGFRGEYDDAGLLSGVAYQGQAVLQLVPGAVINSTCAEAVVDLLDAVDRIRRAGHSCPLLVARMVELEKCIGRLPT
jgi:hypothetical protein